MTDQGPNTAPGQPRSRPLAPRRRGNPLIGILARLLVILGILLVAFVALFNTNGTVRDAVANLPGSEDMPIIGDALAQPRGPEQPINFPHPVHLAAGITCRHCHQYTEQSPVAAIMPAERCMQCHAVVKTESAEIQKLKGYYDRGEDVPWVRVNNIPDFVYFSHRMHIAAGVACASCHGDLSQQARTYQANTLNMGFCISCHRQNNAPVECNTCHK